jgi:hypothetical protein
VAEHPKGDVFVDLGTKRAKRVDDGVEAAEAIKDSDVSEVSGTVAPTPGG